MSEDAAVCTAHQGFEKGSLSPLLPPNTSNLLLCHITSRSLTSPFSWWISRRSQLPSSAALVNPSHIVLWVKRYVILAHGFKNDLCQSKKRECTAERGQTAREGSLRRVVPNPESSAVLRAESSPRNGGDSGTRWSRSARPRSPVQRDSAAGSAQSSAPA